jgi:ribosomal protein S18 acetylase RimI-like enzyme
MTVRDALPTEFELLACLWYDGWQDAHAGILPESLARHRTKESFLQRLHVEAPHLRVTGPVGQPNGLCIAKDDELNQLYVSPAARGSGLARILLSDGEARLRSNGARTAWLACAIGNARAARFYEKNGWSLAGEKLISLETPAGPFPLQVWRYEKAL